MLAGSHVHHQATTRGRTRSGGGSSKVSVSTFLPKWLVVGGSSRSKKNLVSATQWTAAQSWLPKKFFSEIDETVFIYFISLFICVYLSLWTFFFQCIWFLCLWSSLFLHFVLSVLFVVFHSLFVFTFLLPLCLIRSLFFLLWNNLTVNLRKKYIFFNFNSRVIFQRCRKCNTLFDLHLKVRF